MNKTFISNSPEETAEIAKSIARDAQKIGVVCLTGPLGSGKTQFTRGIVEMLCPECLSLVHSPTFAIVNEYIGNKTSVFHFDFYRLKSPEDLYSTGFYDYEGRNGVVVAEWGELFLDSLPENSLLVSIAPKGGDKRLITLKYGIRG